VALLIQNPEPERLLREKAAETGQSVDDLVLSTFGVLNIGQKFTRFKPDGSAYRALTEFRQALAKLPVLDDRSADEILGYDEWGLPH
jgi:antitoxin VapB